MLWYIRVSSEDTETTNFQKWVFRLASYIFHVLNLPESRMFCDFFFLCELTWIMSETHTLFLYLKKTFWTFFNIFFGLLGSFVCLIPTRLKLKTQISFTWYCRLLISLLNSNSMFIQFQSNKTSEQDHWTFWSNDIIIINNIHTD